MSSVTYPPGSFEAECPNGLDWAWYGLGECVQDVKDKVSIAFGIMSIAAWCFFGFPQIYENCVSKIPDTAVSVFLLIFWILGDSLNFIGAFLTGQLFMQKLLAGYTVAIDLILCGQYAYYLFLHKKRERHAAKDEYKSTTSSTKGKMLATVLLGVVALSVLPWPTMDETFAEKSLSESSRQLHQADTTTQDPWADFLSTTPQKIGYTFGWTSAVMYALGRMHQIYLNWHRKCTEGLSFYLFFLAILGNVFYGCQIFIKSVDVVFIVNSLPWIVGSLGILSFDAIILLQFFLYRKNTTATEDYEESNFDFEPF